MSLRILTGPACAWHAVVLGNDILVRGAIATWFGGDDDPMDNGQTASGVNTKANPSLLGCALPIPLVSVTKGGPLPVLPWGLTKAGAHNPGGTWVAVTTPDGKSVTVPLIDIGPRLSTNHPIDLTQQAFADLGGDKKDGRLSVDFRILGGAAFL